MCVVEFLKLQITKLYNQHRRVFFATPSWVLTDVLPFLRDEDDVLDVQDVCFLHDKAPCFKALATQELLRQSGIDFFNNSEWPGSSPDLNPAEDLAAIIKDRVEDRGRLFTPDFVVKLANGSSRSWKWQWIICWTATVIPAQAGCSCCCCWRSHRMITQFVILDFLFKIKQ